MVWHLRAHPGAAIMLALLQHHRWLVAFGGRRMGVDGQTPDINLAARRVKADCCTNAGANA